MTVAPLVAGAGGGHAFGRHGEATDEAGARFEDLLSSLLRQADDFLGRSEGEPGRGQSRSPAPLAERFDEAGFFACATPSAATEAASHRNRGAAAARPAGTGEDGLRQAGAAPEPEPDMPAGPPRPVPAGPAGGDPREAAAGLRTRASPARTGGIAGAASPKPPVARPGAATAPRAELAERRPAGRAERASALAARLSLHSSGQEAELVAQVRGLSGEERARLRAELVQLLARHGLAARSIRLNGEDGLSERP